MTLALTAPNVEDHAALLNFEQLASILGGGTTGQVLTADAHGNAAWAASSGGATQNNDALQAGYVGTVNTGPVTAAAAGGGGLTFTHWPTGDVAYLTPAVSTNPLVRTIVPAAPTPTVSGVTAGDYAYVYVYIANSTQGATGVATLVVGTSRTTAALAAADQQLAAATTTGLLVWDGIALNTAGTYSLQAGTPASGSSIPATGRDRRPWARGFLACGVVTAGNYTTNSPTPVVIDSTNLSWRVECSGVPLRMRLLALVDNAGGNTSFYVYRDGANVAAGVLATQPASSVFIPAPVEYIDIPIAGSHLYQFFWQVGAGTSTLLASTFDPLVVGVEELVRQNANNGTA